MIHPPGLSGFDRIVYVGCFEVFFSSLPVSGGGGIDNIAIQIPSSELVVYFTQLVTCLTNIARVKEFDFSPLVESKSWSSHGREEFVEQNAVPM